MMFQHRKLPNSNMSSRVSSLWFSESLHEIKTRSLSRWTLFLRRISILGKGYIFHKYSFFFHLLLHPPNRCDLSQTEPLDQLSFVTRFWGSYNVRISRRPVGVEAINLIEACHFVSVRSLIDWNLIICCYEEGVIGAFPKHIGLGISDSFAFRAERPNFFQPSWDSTHRSIIYIEFQAVGPFWPRNDCLSYIFIAFRGLFKMPNSTPCHLQINHNSKDFFQ